MASPQVENGHTRIANELLEALCRFRCSGAQKDIIFGVIRATYGFHKKSRAIGSAYLAKLTGRHPKKVASDVAELIRREVLSETQPYSFNKCRTLSLNKNYDEWVSTKSLSVNETIDRVSMKTLTGCQRKRRPNKDTLKDTKKDTVEALASASPNHQKESSKSVSPVEAFRRWWAAEYERRFGERYVFNFGKEGKLIKNLLGAVGDDVEHLRAKALTFLDSSDEFLQRAGYTIGVFYTRFNSIRVNGKPTNGQMKPQNTGLTETQKFLMEQKHEPT